MNFAAVVALAIGVAIATAALTGVFRKYAIAKNLLDVPNARSSHRLPVPRGGGVAMVIATLSGLLLLAFFGRLHPRDAIGICGAGLLTGVVGFMDDRRHIAPSLRLLGHFTAASWVLYWVGWIPLISFGTFDFAGAWFGRILGALYIVWLLNLTNFMDGVDGVAAVEAATVCIGGSLLAAFALQSAGDWEAPLVLGASALGFLAWNWPPARIFMGDAGSGFLGVMIAGFSLLAGRSSPGLFFAWLILAGAFIVDATVTLIVRASNGESLSEAHCNHVYQRAARRWQSHRRVTVTLAAINVLWLAPIAAAVALDGMLPGYGILLAYIPLTVLAVIAGGGRPSAPADIRAIPDDGARSIVGGVIE